MTVLFSWLRRARRSMRVCLASLALLVIWTIPEIVSVMRPVFAAPVLLILAVHVHLVVLDPAPPVSAPTGPADLRLRRLSARTLGPLAAGIVAACIAAEALITLHRRFCSCVPLDPFRTIFVLAELFSDGAAAMVAGS